MSEALYSLSTVGGDVLWASSDPLPTRPSIKNDILEAIQPLYFSAAGILAEADLTVADVRSQAVELAEQREQTRVVAHPTVVEDFASAASEVSLWYLPDNVLGIEGLDKVYTTGLFSMAQRRIPLEEVTLLTSDQDRYCIFVTEVKPEGSRMDLHVDGRKSVIVNLSDPEHRGRTMFGHPDLRSFAGNLTIDQLLGDPRSLVQRVAPGCGVAFDTTQVPHVGISDPGARGYRVVMDADYGVVGRPIDLTVYSSYE